jgi:D-alanine-D-alanine ligase
MNQKFGKVAVLMGGNSAERTISLASGQAILAALLRRGINAIGIDTATDTIKQLTQHQIERVFIALHGRGGEDGMIQGCLENLGIPYTGSGILASALAMDKYRTKLLWQGLNLPTPACQLLHKTTYQQVIEELGLPLVIKPVLEGSSVGISKVNNREELQQAWQTASQYHCEIMAERYIKGAEYTAAILHDQVLPLIKLETPRIFYDYTAKYHDDQTKYHCPCGLATASEEHFKTLMKQAFTAIGAKGWGRVDFICDTQGKPWLLEINTIPGMTDHSLVPMAAKAADISFEELVESILTTAC